MISWKYFQNLNRTESKMPVSEIAQRIAAGEITEKMKRELKDFLDQLVLKYFHKEDIFSDYILDLVLYERYGDMGYLTLEGCFDDEDRDKDKIYKEHINNIREFYKNK